MNSCMFCCVLIILSQFFIESEIGKTQLAGSTIVRDNPANTRRCFDIDLTSFERYGRQIDVETLCAYWELRPITSLWNSDVGGGI